MNEKHVSIIAAELNIDAGQVFRTIQLFETGATIPFVARYRKEATGGLDEVVLATIRDRKEKLEEIDKRRDAILKSLTELELLTPELEKQLVSAATLAELEDIYLPYKPKRKTRASIAVEKGLEPLAKFLMRQDFGDVEREARKFFSEKTGISTIDDALAGARDIVAEWVNETLLPATDSGNCLTAMLLLLRKLLKTKRILPINIKFTGILKNRSQRRLRTGFWLFFGLKTKGCCA